MDSQVHSNGNGSASGSAQTNAAEALDAVLEQVGENAEAILSEVKTAVEKTVRQYPVQSALVCFGVGCVLGALWASRR